MTLYTLTGWNAEGESVEDSIESDYQGRTLTEDDAIALMRERSLIVEVGEVTIAGRQA